MTSFSDLLSSIGDKSKAPVAPNIQQSKPALNQPAQTKDSVGDGIKPTLDKSAARAKRKAEELAGAPIAKTIKTEINRGPKGPLAPVGRFQLSAKPKAPPKAPLTTQEHTNTAKALLSLNNRTALPNGTPKPGALPASGASRSSDSGAKPKRGFASIIEKAKAAQAAIDAADVGGYRHKPVEKLTKRERLRKMEEAKLHEQASRKKEGHASSGRSRSGTPISGSQKVTYQGTMKRPAAEPIAYKGTMRAAGSHPKPMPKKGRPQDKYGGYASWSDLDDAEDGEEGLDEDSLSDMEGGYDDVEMEEEAALRAAKKEDQEALKEEERLERAKMERKRKLEALAAQRKG